MPFSTATVTLAGVGSAPPPDGVGTRAHSQELVDDLLVLGLEGELDVTVRRPLEVVGADIVFDDGQRELGRLVHVHRVVGEDETDHAGGGEALVHHQLADHAGDQLLVGDRVVDPLLGYHGGQHPQELVVPSYPCQVALGVIGQSATSLVLSVGGLYCRCRARTT